MYCLSPNDMSNVKKRLLAELHQSFVQKHLHCVSESRLLLFELRGSRERWRWQNGTASVDRSSGLAKPTLTYGISPWNRMILYLNRTLGGSGEE